MFSFRIIRHIVEKSTLNITVVRCQGLPARDSNVGSSDPYVKLQLLPDKHHKVKTRVLRRTLNPVYDEDFTFYGIGKNQLQVRFISLSIYSGTLTVVSLSADRIGLVMTIYSFYFVIVSTFCYFASFFFFYCRA